jgi:hydrogenase nickel incorporation protein HypA/HybF
MHELSLAHDLVESAVEAAQAAGVQRVTAVNLRLGALAGVVKEALEFGYEIATQGTLLEGSQLVIEELPVRVACADCPDSCALPSLQNLSCPHTGRPAMRVVQGREIQILSLEYEDEPATA